MLALGPDKAGSESARDFVSDYDTANGRRCHRFYSGIRKTIRNRPPEGLGIFRSFEHAGALKVVRAVKPARKHKMAIQKRTCGLESFDYFTGPHLCHHSKFCE
jgi:hypothetical protein